jgi:Fe-S cluster assembly protein SufD
VTSLDAAALERVSAGNPGWLVERRRAAGELFDKLAMPSSTEELWRYVDLDFDLREHRLATDIAAAPGEDAALTAVEERAGVMRVVDGAVVEVGHESPAVFESLASALQTPSHRLEETLLSAVPPDLDAFAAAHGAFVSDGAYLHLPAGTAVEAPYVVDVHAAEEGTVTFPHLLVDAGESTQASIVVRYTSPDEVSLVVVPQVEVFAAANASVALTIIQEWGSATRAVGHQRMVAGRDATVRFAEAGLGGALSRLHLTVDLLGRGSSAEILGAYFGDRRQVLDYRYFMHHAGTNTSSDMFLKGAVEDEALSVFTGMIRIDETAQRTDAFQTNRNLILSDGAAAQSVPNLEILANDVRCGHGSTVGPLDPEQRYYLMSRGLNRQRADRLQVHGFFNEALLRFPEPALAGPVAEAITRKYTSAVEEGRLT